MSTETKTDRVLRDVLNSDNLRDLLGDDAVNNAMKWRFLQGALIVLDGHGLLGDPDAKKDATPAPLDPSKVKAGDTVTVRFIETGEELATKAYRPAEVKAPKWVSILGWPLIKADGVLGLAVQYFEILAIEPAPEPEPEWKPGTVWAGSPHNSCEVHFWVIDVDAADPIFMDEGGNSFGPGELRDLRPLVVIDSERARALVHDHFDDDRSRALLDALLDGAR